MKVHALKERGGFTILIVANSRLSIDHNHADVLAVTRSRQATFSHGYPQLLRGRKLVKVTKTPRGGTFHGVRCSRGNRRRSRDRADSRGYVRRCG